MAKPTLADQLDRAIEAILVPGAGARPPVDARLAALVPMTADLLGLPREDFRARLKTDLQRRAAMTDATKPAREGAHGITPYLVVEGPDGFANFLQQAFGAEELFRTGTIAGGMHVELRIGDSPLMMGGGEGIAPIPAALHLYVSDADAVYRRALAAGAVSLYEPTDQEYGDREAGVKDSSGNHWFIATRKGPQPIPEGMRAVTPYLIAQGAAELIAFLKRALGAEERARFASPEGAVAHAKLQIGDSMLELGEAHGEFQPMPCLLHLAVDNVDAAYDRAVAAGASSVESPADQPYGDRRAAVKDPAGNAWYFAAPIKESSPR
jgi:PhnB protein